MGLGGWVGWGLWGPPRACPPRHAANYQERQKVNEGRESSPSQTLFSPTSERGVNDIQIFEVIKYKQELKGRQARFQEMPMSAFQVLS